MSDTEHLEVSKKYYISDDTLICGNFFEIKKIFKIIENAIIEIQKYDNPRIIVLETWLIFDYLIRQFIVSVLDINNKSYEDFDLREKLLSHSFDACAQLLQGIIKKQQKLEKNPEPQRIVGSVKFWHYVMKNHKETFNAFMKIEQEYLEKEHPGYFKKNSISYVELDGINDKKKDYRFVSDNMIELFKKMDNSWFKAIIKINEVRNKAAHNYDVNDIYNEFNIVGENKLEKLKKICLENLEALLKIKIQDNDNPKWDLN